MRVHMRRGLAGRLVLASALSGAVALAAAQATAVIEEGPAKYEAPIHPWIAVPPRFSPDAYFTNLTDRQKIETPFVAHFGLSMRGIVPAGKTAGNAGHHHLLINQELPLDFKKPLPFTEHYIHFGKGQMEALVDLPPGSYTLRLVLADKGHIPYFVFSKPLHITVTKQNKGVAPETVLGKQRVEVIGPADGATVHAPFRAQFHASGYNVSATAAKAPDTGHFRLTLERGSQREMIDFAGGQTETWLSPPAGNYSARVEFMSNNAPGKVLSQSPPVSFTVN